MHVHQIQDLTRSQILDIFQLADQLRADPGRYSRALAGKTFLLFFPEGSLRTRLTFEKGIRQLGGECLLFAPAVLDKKERLEDVAGYMANWADGMIVRHSDDARVAELCEVSAIPVINAMTKRTHPCEILSDLYSIRERWPHFEQLVYTYVGCPGNIGRTWLEAARVLQLQFRHVGFERWRLEEDGPHYRFCTELETALPGSHVVLTDSLPDGEASSEYKQKYMITADRMRLCGEEALLNPCPPFFRGEEVSADAIASDFFAGCRFKSGLLPVQQAILLYSMEH